MRFSRLALALTAWGALSAGSAHAQSGAYAVPRPSAPVTRVAYDYDTYYTETESTAEAEVTEISTRLDAAAGGGCVSGACDPSCAAACDPSCSAACGAGCANACGNGCAGGCLTGCGSCGNGCASGCGSSSCGCGGRGCLACRLWPCGCKLEDLGDAFKLWEPCCENSQWSMNGWLDQSFVWNPYRPNDRFNGPMTWTDRSNEYQMQELWLGGGRVTNTEGCGFDIGGRVDAFYGTNYRWDTEAGFETNWGNGSFYGAAVPNAYIDVALNNWTVRTGRFVSPVGYFALGSPNNFFPVLPYTFQYGEPFCHTGVWVQNKLNDKLNLGGGFTHGWDCMDNTGNPHGAGLVTATYAPNDKGTLAYVGVIGNEPNFSGVNRYAFNGVGYTPRYLQTLVYSHKFSDDMTGVLQSDYGQQTDAVTAGQTAKWYGLNSYLLWNQTCRCQWGLNGEWFRDQGGFRVGGVLPSFGSPNARGLSLGRSGYDGSFYRLMFGPRYFLRPNMYTRIALAFDWYEGRANNAGGLRPFDDGTKNHQEVVVFDFVTTF